jgi:SAM-dependent methyltransferase
MTTQDNSELQGIKARIKAVWMSGDYPQIANFTEGTARAFIDRLQLKPGSKVLDVACGNGNLAISAAKAGAVVTGIDIAPNLLDEAGKRAAREGVDIRFQEGDAEDLPYDAGSFDLVISMFGAMFAPRPEVVVGELCRVCRKSGQIAMANWTPTGFIGELFRVTGKHAVPPAGVPSPLLWGDETVVRQRLGGWASDIATTVVTAQLDLPFAVPATVEFYRRHYGPTLRTFAALSVPAQAALRIDMEDLYARHNQAADGTTSIMAEYLEIVATRA